MKRLAPPLLHLAAAILRLANRLNGDGHTFVIACAPCLGAETAKAIAAAHIDGVRQGLAMARHPHRPVERALPEA